MPKRKPPTAPAADGPDAPPADARPYALEIVHECEDFTSYRAARVKSLFNPEAGNRVTIKADLSEIAEGEPWQIGLIVGPSGSGKTSIGRVLLGEAAYYEGNDWPDDQPIVEAIAPDGDFDAVTGALAAVGLGDVPAWLRPYRVLSTGQRFRADLARVVADAQAGLVTDVVVDEFTSVVDRQIAKIGAQAFGKAWRRTGGRAVLLSCHYDVADWLQPDWIYDTSSARLSDHRSPRDRLQRPPIHLDILKTSYDYWRIFEPHYYLTLPRPPAAEFFVALVDGEPVAHVAVAMKFDVNYYRSTRLVVMPEWQGAGVGTKFLNWICQYHLDGRGQHNRRLRTLFHTSHPQLIAYLRRSALWVQVSAQLVGQNKARSTASFKKAGSFSTGFGGHFRAVQGFAYIGKPKDV